MPFNARFIEVDRVISEAALECGLEYVCCDRHHQPGSVMPQVVKAIRESAVVVADITDYKPNVLYELGIAHQIKGPDRVVIVHRHSTTRQHTTSNSFVNSSTSSTLTVFEN